MNLENYIDQKIHQVYLTLKNEKDKGMFGGFGLGGFDPSLPINPQLHLQLHYIYSKQKFTQEINDKWKEYIDKYKGENDKLRRDLE